MGINWKIRLKNPMFYVQIILSVIMPVLAYMGLTLQDLTTWSAVWSVFTQAVSNPYVLGMVIVSVYNAVIDPTTTGITDSRKAMEYFKPNSEK